MIKITLLFAIIACVVLACTTIDAAGFHKGMSLEAHKARHLDHMIQEVRDGKNVNGLFPSTIPSLNVTAFLGRWYQTYANALVLDTFSNHSTCATATYGPIDASTGHVGVFNWERQYTITGNVRNVSGYAYQTDAAKNPGELDVRLMATNSPPFPAPYWIFNSSPTLDAQDSWIIVSDPFKLTLFILCRDVAVFEQKNEQEVLATAAQRGFTGFNAPIKIIQGAACNYNTAGF